LKTIELGSGAVETLCDAPNGRGASWGSRGVIVFSPDYRSGLFSILASGGSPVQLTEPGKADPSHRVPFFLPDGKHVLFFGGLSSDTARQGIYVLDSDSRKTQFVAQKPYSPPMPSPGAMFLRNGDLMAQPFSVDTSKSRSGCTNSRSGVQQHGRAAASSRSLRHWHMSNLGNRQGTTCTV
jgi:serine/threonine-protein kinase